MDVYQKNKHIFTYILAGVFILTMYFFYLMDINMAYMYCLFTVLIYLSVLPQKVIDPKNIVFGYYFMFYGVAVVFTQRINYLEEFGIYGSRAFLLCSISYVVIMISLDYFGRKFECKNESMEVELQVRSIDKVVLLSILLISLAVFIMKTGGLMKWITDSNGAYFSRRGSGLWSILWLSSFQIFLFFEGEKELISRRSIISRILYCIFSFILFLFVGSKSAMILLLFLLFSNVIMKIKLRSVYTLFIIISGIAIFIVGMYIRCKSIMTDFSSVLSTCLNYFDTFENLAGSLRDFAPSFGKTMFLPLNWILQRFGTYLVVPYHDMSIWLTTFYTPDTWFIGQGTNQWPIETDLYLSLFYYGGLPLLVGYAAIIAKLFSLAQHKGIWRYIYIVEAVYIISHLRGGVFIFWYFWLIPIYFVLIYRYRRKITQKRT